MMRLRKLSRKTICLGLIVLAGLVIFLPPRWTERFGAATQVLAPAQHGADRLVELTAQTLRQTASPTVSRETYQQTLERTRALERVIASANEQIRRLQEANQVLTRLRDAGLSPDITLVPARIIAVDPASWRDIRMLNQGATRDIHANSWVITRTTVSDTESHLRTGMPVLAGEILVGQIQQVTPFGAKLRLLSDVTNERFPVRVVSDRPPDQQTRGAEFNLRGMGNGTMELFDVHFQYVEDQRIQIGDTVVTGDGLDSLPIPLTVGQIDAIEKNPNHPRLYTCRVKPTLEYEDLRTVHVVEMSSSAAASSG